MTAGADLAADYSATGRRWTDGPEHVYRRLAELLCDRCPVPLGGARVLDLGAGTGAVSAAAVARGAEVVALDVAPGMLTVDAGRRPPAVAGDARALPLRTGSIDAVLAGFSLNHLPDPEAGLREAARVLRPGGAVAASAYAEEPAHPVAQAVDAAARHRGWAPPAWYEQLRRQAIPRLATPERAAAAATSAGLADVRAERLAVGFPELDVGQLVAWRLGMAQYARLLAQLDDAAVDALADDAVARLDGDVPPLVRGVVLLTARAA